MDPSNYSQCVSQNYAKITKIMNTTIEKLNEIQKGKDNLGEFKVSKNAILMTVIAGMGFTINWGAAMFLTYKLKRNNYSPFLRLLRALALSDLCVMVSGALLYGLPGISSTYSHDIQPKISPYLLPMAQTSIMTSVYLAVLMSFERYIRICFTCQLRPFRCITEKNLTWYILACVIFPTCFYIPKWFELTLDVPRACDTLKYLWECLNSIEMNEKEAVKDLKIDQIKSILAKLMSIYCWRPVMETDLVVKQNVVLRSTPLRNDFVYYYVYYMTLNTLFATILPIGALFFFSFSTLRGLHSIRHYFKSSSIPLRCSSSKKSARNSSVNSARDTITRGNMTTSSFISNRNQPDLTPMPTTELAPLTPQSSIQGSTQPSVILDVDPRKNIAVPSAEEKRLTRISIAIVVIYILCHIWKLPLSISEAWYSIAFDTTQVTWKDYNWYNIVHDISHGLILANSAFNFILYLLL